MQWNKVLGRVDPTDLPFIERTSDGGYVAGGVLAHASECWVVKMDAMGNVQWNRTYSGHLNYTAAHVQQTSDGGYIMAGWAYGRVNSSLFGYYAWVMKTREDGVPEWNRTYGVSPSYADYVEQSVDGGYIFGGVFDSLGLTPDHNYVWLVKTDSAGLIQWNRTYGGVKIVYGVARFVHQANDEGYVAGGSFDFANGSSRYFLLKTDSAGNTQWNRTYSQGWVNTESFAASTYDGGYVVAGETSTSGSPGYSTLVVKTDGNGTLEWQKTYDAGWPDVKQTSDGGYVLASGWSKPNSGLSYPLSYPLLIKIDGNGTVQWTKRSWENGAEGVLRESVVQSQDGGYVFAAFSLVNGQSNEDIADFWIAKLASTPTYQSAPLFAFFVVAGALECLALACLASELAARRLSS
jgi:hypothetical protein